MRRAKPPTISRRSGRTSISHNSETGSVSRRAKKPLISSGVYDEPPPMTAIFIERLSLFWWEKRHECTQRAEATQAQPRFQDVVHGQTRKRGMTRAGQPVCSSRYNRLF